jgi:Tfp pilus assembly protein PilO
MLALVLKVVFIVLAIVVILFVAFFAFLYLMMHRIDLMEQHEAMNCFQEEG